MSVPNVHIKSRSTSYCFLVRTVFWSSPRDARLYALIGYLCEQYVSNRRPVCSPGSRLLSLIYGARKVRFLVRHLIIRAV